LAAYYAGAAVRGEVVLVLAGRPAAAAPADPEAVRARARTLREEGASSRDVARALSDEFGLSRNDAYRAASDGRGDITASGGETA
jgi:predicted aminopeptidase